MNRIAMMLTATLLAAPGVAHAQDAAAGAKVFNQCRACHQVGETARNGVGPKLNGLVGRPAGAVEGFSYSAANKNSGLTLDEATLTEYLRDPRAKIPGTKMIFPGVKDDRQIADLIAFLRQYGADGKKP